MSRKKGPDEVYCRSCGDPIKKKAEICPSCGVANEYDGSQRSNSQTQKKSRDRSTSNDGQNRNKRRSNKGRNRNTTASSSQHDPSIYSTTVTDKWYYGVAVSILLWILGFAMPEGSGLAGAFFLLAWVLMPLSIYYDRQWVRATTQWNPKSKIWITLSVIPLVNIVAGGVYLFRRFNMDEVSSPGFDDSPRNDTALEELRERYSRGELTDEEFERKVDQIVGTETEETAKVHMKNKKRSEDD